MKRLLLSALLLAPAIAGAGCLQIINLRYDVVLKGRSGDLLIVYPYTATTGRVMLTIRGLCKTNPPLRKFTRGDEILLACGYNSNPLKEPPPTGCQKYDMVTRRLY